MVFFVRATQGPERGMSLVDILVGAALIGLFFSGIIGGFRLALIIIGHARAESGALALANQRIEYLRALPYDSVGTAGGIPAGTIIQNEPVVLNGVTYNRRTLIQYVDAPDDGVGVLDENGIATDYKRAKIELSWSIRGRDNSIALVSNIIPKGIETLAGGGTLTVNVFDATADPVANAAVRVVNTLTSPAIDVTSYTNTAGIVMFPGAPASGGYEISATKSGYSVDQTYAATAANPNPNPPHVSVIESEISTVNFAIDRASAFVARAVLPPSQEYRQELFADASGINSATSTVVIGGALALATSSDTIYVPAGEMRSVEVRPSSLLLWTEISWNGSVPAQTTALYRVYAVDAGGTYTLIPDSQLPGNSSGFAVGPLSISAISATTTPALAFVASFQSLDGANTPTLADWRIDYVVADVPVPGVAITLSGAKNIGTDALGQPVLKYSEQLTTNAQGTVSNAQIEWGQYDIVINGAIEGYDIGDVCFKLPVTVEPATSATTTLVLLPHTARSLLVRIDAALGGEVAGASVRLSNGSVNQTVVSSVCGHAFFANVPSGSDYQLAVTAAGYAPETVSDVAVAGTERFVVTLTKN